MKVKINSLFAIILMAVLVLSCQKNELPSADELPSNGVQRASDIDTSTLNPNAVTYFSNIKTAIFATGSNLPKTRSESGDESNPLIEKLESIEIVKDETSNSVSFFEMDETEQELFLNDWTILQAAQMSQKISENPELLDHILLENEVIGSVLNEEVAQTRSGVAAIKDTKAFFSKIQERFAEKGKQLLEQHLEEQDNGSAQTRVGISFGSTLIPLERFKSNLVASARRGDFLVALPMHGQPYVYLDFGNDKFQVGHAAVIITNSMEAITKNTEITMGANAYGVGVVKESADHWSVQSYIVGIQRVRWVWKWRGFRSGFYRECTPVSNPDALAYWAEQYDGREYVRWYEFPVAKWVAPTRFTCTTLVWWCAKKAYDINVSAWWSTLVTPGGLLTDESTYIRKVNN